MNKMCKVWIIDVVLQFILAIIDAVINHGQFSAFIGTMIVFGTINYWGYKLLDRIEIDK